jgi:hypothetical protein
MKAVHIFGGVDREENFFGIDVRRERKLDEDAVDFVARIETSDEGEEFFGGGVLRGGVLLAVDADFFAGFDFAADVNFGSGIVADEDDGEAGTKSPGYEGLNFFSDFGADISSDTGAVENTGGHRVGLRGSSCRASA